MIKITIGSPGITDGVSYYRAAGPLARLRQQMSNLEIDYPPQFGWHDIKSADIIMIQRPGAIDHEKIIKFARQCDTPVWVDMDDDLLDVPAHNPGWEVFRERNNIVISCLKNADIVSTATETLAKKFRQYNPNVVVVPNGLDEKMLKGYDPISKKTDSSIVYWRGASGHIKDLMLFEDQIVKVADEFSNQVRWQFAGYWPWHLYDKIDKLMPKRHILVDHLKAVDVMDYFSYLKHHSTHATTIIPLENCQWNIQKSNIAWLENTFAGSQCLVPDYCPEFDVPGVIKYSNPEDFYLRLIDMIKSPPDHKAVQDSLEYIQEHLTLSIVNKKRMEIIEKLLS